MGTRADFYVGRGTKAEWLGSIAYDGYPYDKSKQPAHWKGGVKPSVLCATTEKRFRTAVAKCLKVKNSSGTTPDQGWPWPWPTSSTTDYAYAFDEGRVWISRFGSGWQDATYLGDNENQDEHLPAAAFPNMCERQNVVAPGDSRSGCFMLERSK